MEIYARNPQPRVERKLGKEREKQRADTISKNRSIPRDRSLTAILPGELTVFMFFALSDDNQSGSQGPGNLFEFLTRTKNCYPVGAYRYNFSGFRITSLFSTFTGPDFEGSKSAQFHNPIFLQTILQLVEKLVKNPMDILAVNAGLFEYTIDYFGFL